MNRRILRGAGIGALGLVVGSGAHYLNLLNSIAVVLLRGGEDFPAIPGRMVSHAALYGQALLVSVPLALAVGLGSMLRRGLACLAYLVLWFWGLARLGALFAPEGASGTIWLLWHPGITPAFGLAGAMVIFLIMDPEHR